MDEGPDIVDAILSIDPLAAKHVDILGQVRLLVVCSRASCDVARRSQRAMLQDQNAVNQDKMNKLCHTGLPFYSGWVCKSVEWGIERDSPSRVV
jgi:hypothetical protein